jgi:protoheme IX farnesyltransferase
MRLLQSCAKQTAPFIAAALLPHSRQRAYFLASRTFEPIEDKWRLLPRPTPTQPNILTRVLSAGKPFAELSKPKLSSLVVLTTMSGYALGLPFADADASASAATFLLTVAGTAFSAFSANSFNQWLEQPLDAQMPRTRSRPLPRLAVTPFAAFNWAVASGVGGLGLLGAAGGWPCAGWSVATIVLYAACYTPLKRISPGNTALGAVVGALPPLIGWSAATQSLFSSNPAAALVLPALLFIWQFPHFNALSCRLVSEYARAGYRMLAVLDPHRNRRNALLWALMLVPWTGAACLSGLVGPVFLATATIVNGPLIYLAARFYRDQSQARRLFLASLAHLPLLLALLIYHRKGSVIEEPTL